ncbi:hypothetical protein HK096_007331, partial [Nowakowskiella sp. JEL0078]
MAGWIKNIGSDFQRNQFSASQTYAMQATPGLGYFPTFPSAIPSAKISSKQQKKKSVSVLRLQTEPVNQLKKLHEKKRTNLSLTMKLYAIMQLKMDFVHDKQTK